MMEEKDEEVEAKFYSKTVQNQEKTKLYSEMAPEQEETKLPAGAQVYKMDDSDLALKTPFRLCVSGPSQCGKSYWCQRLMQERKSLIDKPFDHVWYHWPGGPLSDKDQKYHEQLREAVPNIEICEGLPNWQAIISHSGTKCVILDDLGLEVMNSNEAYKAFTIWSNHFSCSIIFVVQNFYLEGKYASTIRRNFSYTCLFLDRGNRVYLSSLSKRLVPSNGNFLADSLQWSQENLPNMFSPYILIDQSTLSKNPNSLTVRTHIFKNPETGRYQPIFFNSE